MNLNIFIFTLYTISWANKGAQNIGTLVLVAQNCQSCPEGHCGEDSEIEAAGSKKCILITSAKTSNPKASESSNMSIETSSATKTKSNGLSDMSVVSISIFNANSSTYSATGPPNTQ